MRLPSLGSALAKKSSGSLVGLDIQPGYVAAVQARVNGALQVQRAAGMSLPGDAMREGEVLDEGTLAEALRELFAKAHLDKHVRVGVANQRTVLRMLEMPPLPEGKELAAAVRFQAEDQMPMPLDNAVLDFHPLGVVETPAGQRQRVAVVAAQRDMIERLLSAVRRAGLSPQAIDLSAFALIRALHRQSAEAEGEEAARTLYLNVGGLTNMAIAEGPVCRFTRVVGGGLESMAATVAERHHLPLDEARALMGDVDLNAAPAPVESPAAPSMTAASTPAAPSEVAAPVESPTPAGEPPVDAPTVELDGQPSAEHVEAAVAFEPAVAPGPAEQDTEVMAPTTPSGPDVRPVMESGIREIANDIRNSLDFHRTQGGGGEVSSIVLSGPALGIPGFSDLLSRELGVDVRRQTVAAAEAQIGEGLSVEHIAVAAGLAIEEAPGR